MTDSSDPLRRFERHRDRLTGLAYRMLGSRADAEDVVQDAWLRWAQVDRESIESSEAFLVRVVSRLCLDRLRSARHKREVYVGPWLPEPVADADRLSPENAVELADDLSFGLLLALDRLSPPERAAFLLHDVFEVPFAEVAATLDRSPAACRQLASRARRAIRRERPAPQPTVEHERLLDAFVEATTSGDPRRIGALLAEDAVLLSDGGGRVPAALNPIQGAPNVVRLISSLFRKLVEAGSAPSFARAVVNGEPGLLLSIDGRLEETISIGHRNGLIETVYVVRNPDKLSAFR